MSTEYWYDERTGQAAVNFIQNKLRLTKGEWAGKPFLLSPWEEHDIIRPLFGWKRADGTRRYRRCIVWVPRKNGKTELAAGIGLTMLLGDGEQGPEVYAIARDKEQARIVFDKSSAMVQMSPELSPLIECLKTALYCSKLGGAIKPLSGTPEGKHGLNMSGLIGDEVHEWADDRLYTFVRQSAGTRRQPLEFLISTAGEKRGYAWELWNECLRIRDDPDVDPETLVVIYAAEEGDDWTDPATWAKANPNLGVSVKLSYLEAQCREARESPRKENDFRRYFLNQWTEQAVRWLPMEKWDAHAGPVGWAELAEQLRGEECFAGFDLSSTQDLTAKVLVFPPTPDRAWWGIVPHFYVPEENIAKRVKKDKVPYDKWLLAGALIATPGNVIDYEWIKQGLRDDCDRYRVLNSGWDPWNATQVMIQMAEEGAPVEKVRQGFLTLSGPSKELEKLVLDSGDSFRHGGHPILRWCAQNVAVETDAAGNIKPSKAKSTERIDGIAALVTASALALNAEADMKTFSAADVMVI